jgi:RNA polymerase sigma-70 factor (ECF subfamily)
LDQSELINAACAGDPDAERALYEAHVDRIFRLAYRMTGDEALAQDLTQETFIRAFDRLDSFRGDAALATWLHAIATRVILNSVRKIKRLRERELALERAQEPRTADRGDIELRMTLHRAIDALPADLRLVMVMHDIEGFKHREIAAALAIAPATSKTRLFRARSQLRRQLVRSGLIRAEKDAS